METCFMLAIYGIQLIKYRVVLDVIFHQKIRWQWIQAVGAVMIAIVSGFGMTQDINQLLIEYAIILVVVWLIMDGEIRERIGRVLLVMVLINSVDEMFSTIEEWVLENYADIPNNYYSARLLSLFLGFLCLIIVCKLIPAWKKKHSLPEIRRRHVSAVIIVSGIMLMSTIALLNICKVYIINCRLLSGISLIVSFSYISLSLLCWLLIYFQKMNRQKDEIIKTEKELRESQMKYYQMLLKKEEETRSFRHDLINHIFCLKQLAGKENIDGIKDYLQKISGSIKEIQNISYVTGNELFDAILNDKIAKLNGDINVTVNGKFLYSLSLSDPDLCTIYANLFQNAVEELSQINKGERRLVLTISSGVSFTEITIENSVMNAVQVGEDSLPKSRKKDLRNHGFGINNVKEVLEKNGGTLEISCSQESFKVITRFPNNKINYHSRS